MKIDKAALYEDIESKFPDPSFGENVNLLSRDCMKLAEEWLDTVKNSSRKTKRELRKDLKDYINNNIDLKDNKKPYYLASFVWVFLAQMLITFIVRWIIEKYTSGRGK